ncbi:MAG: hypothetical protein MJ229_01655 [bacterium]|nr:hypothetical protein [bacterium]
MKIQAIQNFNYNANPVNSVKNKKNYSSPSFEQIKPEYMFINSKGYSKDVDWAKSSVEIINKAKELIQNNTKFDDLIKYISGEYHYLYVFSGLFGFPRLLTISNEMNEKYEPYNKMGLDFLEKNSKTNNYRVSAKLKSQNINVNLNTVTSFEDKNGNKVAKVISPPDYVVTPTMKEIGEIYKSIQKEDNIDKIVDSTAQIHWLMSQARPYVRGTAGIADILCKSIFEAKGIQVSEYKEGINPNIEAFFTQIDEFSKKYPSFFSEPLKQME